MKKNYLFFNFLCIITLFTNFNIKAQICGTSGIPTLTTINKTITNSSFLEEFTPICINVYYHIVTENSGSGGFNPSLLDEVTSKLNLAYNPHFLYINNLGFDYINNSTYYNIDDTGNNSTEFNALVQINNRPNAINIYIVNNAQYGGKANGILSQALVITKTWANTEVISHEVGHCLNLWHTFQGTAPNSGGGCPEAIDGSNCTTCGDLICDTPADAGIGNANGYNPDLDNIMSYDYPFYHFSNGQAARIRQAFASSSILQNIISSSCAAPKLSGADFICNDTSTNFTLENGGNNVLWRVSDNLQVISSSNSSITVQSLTSNISGKAFVEAVLPLNTFKRKFWLGIPILSYAENEDLYMCRDITTTSNNFFPAITDGVQASTTWEVENITTNHYVTMQGNEALVSLNWAPPFNYIAFKVRATNSCGYSEWLEYYVTVIDSCDGGGSNYLVYPNPTSDTLILENSNKEDIHKHTTQAYEFFDFNGNLVNKGTLNDKNTIDVSGFKKGQYILKIYNGEKTITQNIIIN